MSRTQNGHRLTMEELLKRARSLAETSDDDLDKTMLYLLIALVNRQDDIVERIERAEKEARAQITGVLSTPVVAVSEFIRANKGVSLLVLGLTIAILILLANLTLPRIVEALQIP